MKKSNKKFQSKKELITDDIDVESELYIEDEHLNEEIMDQPLKFRKWSRLEVRASRKTDAIELKLRTAEARAYSQAKNNEKKMTVKDIESYVDLDENVQQLRVELVDARAELLDLKMIVKAFYQRHESLKDLAANFRKELID